MGKAMGLAIVVFSPVLTAATVGSFVGGAAGSSGWLSALAGAVVMACVGVAIVPFARRFVVSGALYSYIGHVFGRSAKFVTGASLAVGYAVGMMVMLGVLGLYASSMMSSVFGFSGATSLPGQVVIYLVTITTAGLLAFRSLDTSVKISIWLLILSAPVVVVVLVANLFTPGFDFGSQFTFGDFSMGGFTLGLVLCATFFVGFEASAATALETADPMRTVPRLMIRVPLIVGGIAVLASLLSVPSLGAIGDQIAAGESPISAMAQKSGLGFLAPVADVALVLSSYAIVVGFLNYASRVWATMASEGLLPASIGRVHRRTHTPAAAILTIGIVALVFPIVLSAVTKATPFEVYQYLATLFPYLWVLPYVLICIGSMVLLRRAGELTVARTIACVVGVIGIGGSYVNSIVNPTGTPLDYMTWVAPAAIAAMMLIMAARQLVARRSDTGKEA
ncbi:APC family permease [Amycolatopsis sp. CFH S0078]|nr:APC family permease [Amycolatopsis sp. CFH S0078]